MLWLLGIALALHAQYDTGYHNIVVGEHLGVKCIVQDADGLVWMGARNELYSYDGYQCTPHHLSGDSNDPFTIYCMTLRDDRFYIGSDRGLYIYDARSGRCSHPDLTARMDIRCILMEENTLYLACMEGIYIYQEEQQTLRPLCPDLRAVYTLLRTPKGVLAGTSSGLFLIHDEEYTAYPIRIFVNSLAHDEGSRYWIGTEGYLFSLDLATDHLEAVAEMQGNSIKTMLRDNSGHLLMGTDNGLFVREEEGHISHYRHDTSNSSSMSNNVLWSVFIDRQENLWLGHNAGLSLLRSLHVFTRIPLQQLVGSDEGNFLNQLHFDRRSQLWAGGSNGLHRFARGHRLEDNTWYRQGSTQHPLTNNFIRCIYEDSDGDIWTATDGGINLYQRQTDQMRNFLLYNASMTHNANWAYALFVDRQQRLWVGAYDGGVFVIDKQRLLASNGECMADHYYPVGRGGLSGLHVMQMLYTQSGEVWVTSSDGGVDRIDPQSRLVTHVTDRTVFCLMEDHRQRIWTGYDGGLCCYSPGRQQPETYDLSDPYTRIISLEEVDGRIWAFSRSSCRVIDSLGHVSLFRLPMNNLSATCYAPCMDRFIVGGIDEILTFRSDVLSLHSFTLPLFLSSLQINNADVNLSRLTALQQEGLRLPTHENNLQLHFTDMPYCHGMGFMYAYRLKGNSQTWLPLDPKSLTIHLIGLPHGRQLLEIAVMDGLGRPADTVYRLPIHILPPWYLTWWAYLLYLLSVVGLTAGVLKYYSVRRHLIQEEEALQTVLDKQEARSRFFHQLSTELKRPIADTLVTVTQLCERTHSDETLHRLSHIRGAATQLNTLLRHAFDLNSSRTIHRADLLLYEIDLHLFCQQAVAHLQPLAAERGLTLDFESATSKHVRQTVGIVRFDAILYILLRFALQQSGAGGHVRLTLLPVEGALQIRIEAGQTPFAAGPLDHLFLRRQESVAPMEENNTELYLAREYAQAMQATLSAHCEQPGALQLQLTLPGQAAEAPTEAAHRQPAIAPSAARTDSDERLMAGITATIEKHIMDYDFNVSILQYEMGIGSKLLYRKVKSATGLSPVEYIRSIRMHQAALLLREGNFSVSEVMYMVGYTNASYFAKCFQKSYGMTPTRFAKSPVRQEGVSSPTMPAHEG